MFTRISARQRISRQICLGSRSDRETMGPIGAAAAAVTCRRPLCPTTDAISISKAGRRSHATWEKASLRHLVDFSGGGSIFTFFLRKKTGPPVFARSPGKTRRGACNPGSQLVGTGADITVDSLIVRRGRSRQSRKPSRRIARDESRDDAECI